MFTAYSLFPDCPKGRMVATKRGVGKFTTLVKAPSGDTEHWDVDFNACGILIVSNHLSLTIAHFCSPFAHFLQTGKNPKTGDSCKLWMKRFTDFSGDWRPVSISGVKSALLAMGKLMFKDVHCSRWFMMVHFWLRNPR